jgi:hypothetical protein
MNRTPYNILLLLLALLPGWLTMAPAVAQNGNVVYAGEVMELSVIEVPGDTYVWDLYNDPSVNFANTDGNIDPSEAEFVGGVNTGATVSVRWLRPGIYFFRVMAFDPTGCTNNLKVGMIEILPSYPIANFLDPDPVCVDDPGLIEMVLIGEGPWDVTYTYTLVGSGDTTTVTINDINNYQYELFVTHAQAGTYEYTIVSVSDSRGLVNDEPSEPVYLRVDPRPITSPIYRYDPLGKAHE